MQGYIYVISNPFNNKHYVGQSWRIENRWKKYQNGGCNKSQPKLYNAFKKYGPKTFLFYIIDAANTQESLNTKEKYWVDSYDSINNGYNVCEGGIAAKRHPLTQAHKEALRKANTGRKISEDTRRRLSESHKNHKVKETTKEKLRAFNLGKVLSDEHKEKIGKSNIGKLVSEQTRHKQSMKRVKFQYTVTDPCGNIYTCLSLYKFCIENNLQNKYMYCVVDGKLDNFKGWKVSKLRKDAKVIESL